VKYSDDGPVEVVVSGVADRATLTVRDRGRGIAPEDVTTIFEEFERGRLAEEDGGQGLGLTSVRSLVDELGGRISVESAVGQGTAVVVELPNSSVSGSVSSASA
jgi:signal transduction histidine kinase